MTKKAFRAEEKSMADIWSNDNVKEFIIDTTEVKEKVGVEKLRLGGRGGEEEEEGRRGERTRQKEGWQRRGAGKPGTGKYWMIVSISATQKMVSENLRVGCGLQRLSVGYWLMSTKLPLGESTIVALHKGNCKEMHVVV